MKTKRWPFLVIGIIVGVLVGFFVGFGSGMSVGFQAGLGVQRHLANAIEKTNSDTEENKAVWFSQGQSPEVYARAAHSILQKLGQEDIWLTPGNVIMILGQPARSSINGIHWDEQDNVDPTIPRLNLFYKEDKVIVEFSLCGIVDSVVHFVKPEHRKGWGFPDDFPKIISESKWPLLSGFFQNAPAPATLVTKAEQFAQELKTEADWYPVVEKHFKDDPQPETPSGLNIPCKSQIVLIDGLRNNLVIITFVVKGKHTYWIDTWWNLVDEEWRRVPPHEGQLLIARRNGS